MLRPGGRAAVIIPEGVLFGGSQKSETDEGDIVEDNQLEAVISRPAAPLNLIPG